MKIIESSVKLITETIPGKKMERAGRNCYMSTDKISDESYITFLKNIYKSGHLSVMEHERLIVKVDLSKQIPYLIGIDQKDHMKFFSITTDEANKCVYISSNIRGWVDATKNTTSDIGYYKLLQSVYPFIFTEEKKTIDIPEGVLSLVKEEEVPEQYRKYHDSKTLDIVCSRACSHQIVRHRTLSFSQQSQRYVNFSKDKFGHSINFILPDMENITENVEEFKAQISSFYQSIENMYFALTEQGLKAEDARSVLNNGCATEIICTGTTADWENFVALRSDLHAQAEIRHISDKIKEILSLS